MMQNLAVTFVTCVDDNKPGGKIMQKTSMNKSETQTKQFAKLSPLQ
jgi:hypothetical protein